MVVVSRIEDLIPAFLLPRMIVRDSGDDGVDDEVARACKEALATSEALLVPPAVIYSCSVAALLCVVLTALMGFTVGYNTGVYSIPAGIEDVLKPSAYAPSTSG